MNKHNECDSSYKKLIKAPYQLIAVMIVLVILITAISIYRLYHVGFEEQKKRLTELVQSRAVLIDGLIEHEQTGDKKGNAEEVVLKELMFADTKFEGFGKTGEYTLAKLDKDKIHFLLRHRHNEVDRMKSVSMNSDLAEPMRRALNGKSGTLVGLDYRGELVLAAHEPLKSINWGIVAKIDLTEIQAPYIQEGVYGLICGVILIVIGSIIVIYFIHPLARDIERNRKYNRMLFTESPIGLVLTDTNGQTVDANPSFLKLLGYTMDELLNLSYWDITPQKYETLEEEQTIKLLEDGFYGPYEKEYIHKDGHLINVKLSGRMIEKDGEVLIWSSIEDITEQKHNEIALKEASLVFEHTHEGIIITDADIKIVRVNGKFTQLTGYTFEEVVGKNPSFLHSGSHDEDFYKDMWNTINSKGIWYGELNNRRKNGAYFATLQSITAVKNKDGSVNGYVSVFSDISERKNQEMRMAHLATHDSLTSLPNRILFHDNLNQAIHSAKRNNYKIGVLFLDLNRFKEVNDTMGHEAGDCLLQEVAKRLGECVREEDTVARLGGDEFAIILSELKSSEDALEIAKKIIQKVSEPLNIGKNSLIPSTSIGISIYPQHGEDGDTLVKLADKAMYAAKQKKQDRYELFDIMKNYEKETV
ncbi:MAG: diguanylate cyclase [Sulfurimonas sp.]|jgi:diguanylate cyclase (GGDEF)-like protein/PAS domain S-box-containing protein